MRSRIEIDWLGIPPRQGKVGVLWVYNNPVGDWYQRLRPEVQQILGPFGAPGALKGFPSYPTLQSDLTATEINLLASLSAWVVGNDDNAERFQQMYSS